MLYSDDIEKNEVLLNRKLVLKKYTQHEKLGQSFVDLKFRNERNLNGSKWATSYRCFARDFKLMKNVKGYILRKI